MTTPGPNYPNAAYASPTYDNPTGATTSDPLHPLVPVSIVLTGVLLLAGVWMAFTPRLSQHLYRPWTWFFEAPGWLVSPLGYLGFGVALLFGALGGVPLGLFLGRATQHPGWAVLGPVGAVLAWPALLSIRMIHGWWETSQAIGSADLFIDRMVRPNDMWAALVLVTIAGLVASVARATRPS